MNQREVGESYDTIIIGAGPAGSTLGYLLSKSNLKVLLVDQASFPRPKLCGGLITWKTRSLIEEIFGSKFDELFLVENISDHFYVYEKRRQIIFLPSPEPFYFIDRQNYDATLLRHAIDGGCERLLNERVVRISETENEIITQSGRIFKGRVIVGADGVNSLARRMIYSQEKFRHDLALAMQVNVPYDLLRQEYRDRYPKIFFGTIQHGYSWIFPNKERALLGMGGLMRKNKEPLSSFNEFLTMVLEENREPLKTVKAHTIPFGNFVDAPGRDRLLLVGDSAGLVDPFLGEGIYYAHKSAACASKAILRYFAESSGRELAAVYKADLSPLYKELAVAKRFRNLAFSKLRLLGYKVFKGPAIYNKFVDLVHGKKSYLRLPIISRFT